MIRKSIVYNDLRTLSRVCRKLLKFPSGDLYNVIMYTFKELTFNFTPHISMSFSLLYQVPWF